MDPWREKECIGGSTGGRVILGESVERVTEAGSGIRQIYRSQEKGE